MPDIDHLHTVIRERRLRSVGAAALVAVFAGLLCAGSWPLFRGGEDAALRIATADRSTTSTFLSLMRYMKDTLYTAMPEYLEVRLDSQILIRHARDGTSRVIPISTGNPALARGIETRSGVFLVQNKIEWLYSLQFDSTKVFNWLGFNWGIGFHSLATRGYYRNLGLRPSSHGCIRVGEDDAKALYRTVALGTPVLVHHGSSARTVAFARREADIGDTTLTRSEAEALHARRLQDLYDGARLSHVYALPAMDRRSIGHSGIPIGDEALLPARQRIPPSYATFHESPQVFTRGHRPPVAKAPARKTETEGERIEPLILP